MISANEISLKIIVFLYGSQPPRLTYLRVSCCVAWANDDGRASLPRIPFSGIHRARVNPPCSPRAAIICVFEETGAAGNRTAANEGGRQRRRRTPREVILCVANRVATLCGPGKGYYLGGFHEEMHRGQLGEARSWLEELRSVRDQEGEFKKFVARVKGICTASNNAARRYAVVGANPRHGAAASGRGLENCEIDAIDNCTVDVARHWLRRDVSRLMPAARHGIAPRRLRCVTWNRPDTQPRSFIEDNNGSFQQAGDT